MPDQQEYLRRVAEIAETVRAEAAQADRDRHLGDKTVAALQETGLLRMLLPARYGGGELTLGDSFAVCEALARVDGSAGWNLNIGVSLLSNAVALADLETRDEILGDPDTIVAGTINFMNTKVRRVTGGFVFDGNATFMSGSWHATWLVIGGWLVEDGQPAFGDDSLPVIVRGLVPIDAVTLIDGWRVSGMRATASNDAPLDALFVPDRYICTPGDSGLASNDPAAVLPMLSRFGGGLAFVAIGTARGALDALISVASHKVVAGGSAPLRERADVQVDAGRARALIEAGSAFVSKAWGAAEDKVRAGQPVDLEDQTMLRLSYVLAAEHAAAAADLVCRAGGSSSLFESQGIERFWRDANAVTKHAAVSARFYERIGGIILGLPPASGMI